MTLYINFRSQHVGGSVIDPYVVRGDITTDPLTLKYIDYSAIGSLVAGKNVLIGVHGFNVSLKEGVRVLGQLEPYLGLSSAEIFLGVLWPGDYWLPVVNYPFEGRVSMDCGRRLATFCNRWFSKAQSLSFVSHSLGARLVLEAVKNLERVVQSVCLTAAAVNKDCLATEYSSATQKSSAISILASRKDWVLQVAFHIGDPIADLLNDVHTPF
jgi:esterase/lipase superfamily enzyme